MFLNVDTFIILFLEVKDRRTITFTNKCKHVTHKSPQLPTFIKKNKSTATFHRNQSCKTMLIYVYSNKIAKKSAREIKEIDREVKHSQII